MMNIGILLITHQGIGRAFIDVLTTTFGTLPLKMDHICVSGECEPETLTEQAISKIDSAGSENGTLVLTDMFGSTPSNISHNLLNHGLTVRVITGVNLPMLFRILSYPYLSLDDLATKALSGGVDGIFESHTTIESAVKHDSTNIARSLPLATLNN